jgi:hypothetical protein
VTREKTVTCGTGTRVIAASIEVAKGDKTPGKALDDRPGRGRKANSSEGRRAGNRTSTLEETESSRKDELDPPDRGTASRVKPPDRLKTVESRRTGTTQKVPSLLAYENFEEPRTP